MATVRIRTNSDELSARMLTRALQSQRFRIWSSSGSLVIACSGERFAGGKGYASEFFNSRTSAGRYRGLICRGETKML